MKPTSSSYVEILKKEERRKALRYLLHNPMVHVNQGSNEDFRLILRYKIDLQEWFAVHLGWRLIIEQDFARLHKKSADLGDSTRPARLPGSGQGTILSRRSYAIFCLTAAALEKLDHQTDLTRLTEQLLALLSMDAKLAAALPLDFSIQSHRSELIHAIRIFEELRILMKVDGDDQQFLQKKGDALYTVRKTLLVRLLNVQHSPTSIQVSDLETRIRLMMQEVEHDNEEEARNSIRKHLMRRLLDDPVLYYDELTPDQLAYLHSQRTPLLRILTEATGLVAEIRKEGIALVDPECSMSDIWMPEEGTEGHCTLLIADFFAQRFRNQGPDATVNLREVEQWIGTLAQMYPWRKDAKRPGAEVELAQLVLSRLAALRLIRRISDIEFQPRPAITRYRIQKVEIQKVREKESPIETNFPQEMPPRPKVRAPPMQQPSLFPDSD